MVFQLEKMEVVKRNIIYKILAYNIIRMEEDEEDEETFWYHCARLVKALTFFFSKTTKTEKQ